MANRLLWMLLTLTCGAITIPGLIAAQSPEIAVDQLVLTVFDSEGRLIDGSKAVLNGVRSYYASPDGRIRIRQPSGFHYPATVEVSAQGYKKQRVIIRPDSRPRIDVFLEKIPQKRAVDGRTISVDELSGDDILRADRLHRQAIELLKAGKSAEARTLLFDAERLHPSSATIKNSIGVTLLRERKFMQANEWIETAYEMEPYNASFAGNLGLLRLLQQRSEESYILLRKAVELGCDTETVHYLLGILALQKHEWKLSQRELSGIDPEHFPYSILFLSVALHRLHETDDAHEKFQEFLDQNPAPLFETSPP